MANDRKVFIGGDFQIPYEDKRATALWFKVMKAYKPDEVLLPGDIVDFPEYGRWADGGTQEFLNNLPAGPDLTEDGALSKVFDNAKDGREFYQKVRETCPDARIRVALGNHDIRIWNYFDKKMPGLLEHITPESLWRFNTLGIEHIMYEDRPMHLWGGIHMHHGVSISKHAGESVRNDIDNFGVSLIRGHSHRAAYYHKTYNLRNEVVQGWEMGCMMDKDSSGASYDNVHNWQLAMGSGIVESGVAGTVDGNRAHIEVHPLNDYSVMVGGKIYKG